MRLPEIRERNLNFSRAAASEDARSGRRFLCSYGEICKWHRSSWAVHPCQLSGKECYAICATLALVSSTTFEHRLGAGI